MNNKEKTFSYSYSANRKAELKKIREKYMPEDKPEEGKMERIRRLDSAVHSKAVLSALILGIISALIMGSGMSLVMTDLGKLVGDLALPLGIGIGLLGILGVMLAYPVYQAVTARERKKIAPEILRLTEELMDE